ncbi:MAG: DUF2938 domain-containing protein [Telluria sp.]
MNELLQDLAHVAVIGIGATVAMDLWLLLLKRLKVPTLNFALLGRWIGHLFDGQWKHEAIAQAAPIRGELALGWFAHYAIGIAFAALLVGVFGSTWMDNPSLLPALAVGIATVAAPLFLMQPAMGAGIASSKTATPAKNCLRSVLNHAVFGAGLYAAAVIVAWSAA